MRSKVGATRAPRSDPIDLGYPERGEAICWLIRDAPKFELVGPTLARIAAACGGNGVWPAFSRGRRIGEGRLLFLRIVKLGDIFAILILMSVPIAKLFLQFNQDLRACRGAWGGLREGWLFSFAVVVIKFGPPLEVLWP